MKIFNDAAGRTWTISLTLGSAMYVKEKLHVDLMQPELGDPPLISRIGTDEMFLAEIVCCLLEKQFEANKTTEADVRNSFDGSTLFSAQQAFYDELIDFFQSRGRLDRSKAVAKQKAILEMAIKAAENRIEAIDMTKVIAGMTSGESQER